MSWLEIISKDQKSTLEGRILVVDDAALNRELIISYLEHAGFKNLETAVNGLDALAKTESFHPDLIILDLIMPEMNGLEVIRILRSDAKYAQFKQIPIVVQTTINEPEQKIEAWNSGASDVLTKPIHRLELISRINVQLKNIFLIHQLEEYQEKANQDITQALELQQSLLPNSELIRNLNQRYNVQTSYVYRPSRFLSGDLWGMFDVSDTQLGVWICDFSGKGIRAALNTFRLHTLIKEHQYCATDPVIFVESLNNCLVDLMPIGQFATFLFGIIDRKNNTFVYSSASSTHPIIYYPKAKEIVMGDGTGVPLGIIKSQKYNLCSIALEPNSSLILYSDLLWEDRAIPGISFKEEDIDNFIRELNGRAMVSTIQEQINMLQSMNINFVDDLTLIEIAVK